MRSVTPPIALPQLVPSRTCLQCDVCCRFPDPDSALRPYFTENEIALALAGGIEGTAFPNRRGSQVILVPDPHGEGYLCPAFDAATSTCRIYEQRPFDCQLYPLALMWNEPHDQVLLGWDTKCPFMREEIPAEIQRHADRVMALLDQPGIRDHVVAHPRLIGRFQEDVVVLARPSAPHRSRGWSVGACAAASVHTGRYSTHDDGLGPVWSGATLSRSRPIHRPITTCGMDCWPIGGWSFRAPFASLRNRRTAGSCPCLRSGPARSTRPCRDAMGLLRRWNGDSPVSRVENVPSQLVPEFERLGYRLTPKEPDYLYRATDLAALAGDRYKSQRALCNRFEREQSFEVSPIRWATVRTVVPFSRIGHGRSKRKGSNHSVRCCWPMRRRLMKLSGRRRRLFESRERS